MVKNPWAAGATPHLELTALPRPPIWTKGEEKGREKEKEQRKWEGEGRVELGKR